MPQWSWLAAVTHLFGELLVLGKCLDRTLRKASVNETKNEATLTQFPNIFIWERRQRGWGQQLQYCLSLTAWVDLTLEWSGASYSKQEVSRSIYKVYNGLNGLNAKKQRAPPMVLPLPPLHIQSIALYYATGVWIASRTWEHTSWLVRELCLRERLLPNISNQKELCRNLVKLVNMSNKQTNKEDHTELKQILHLLRLPALVPAPDLTI